MMNITNFILVSVIILIFVQSSKSGDIVEWRPYSCTLGATGSYGKGLKYMILHSDFLYFFFEEFVVRIKQIRLLHNHLRRYQEHDIENYFIITCEPEYAKYDQMPSEPDIMRKSLNVFFQLVDTDYGMVSHVYEEIPIIDFRMLVEYEHASMRLIFGKKAVG